MRELAQWVRVLDAKPEGPGISGTHIIEGENQLHKFAVMVADPIKLSENRCGEVDWHQSHSRYHTSVFLQGRVYFLFEITHLSPYTFCDLLLNHVTVNF